MIHLVPTPHPALVVPTKDDVYPGEAPLPTAAARHALGVGDLVGMHLFTQVHWFRFMYGISVEIDGASARALSGRIGVCDVPEALDEFDLHIGCRIIFLPKHIREIYWCKAEPDEAEPRPRQKRGVDNQASLI